MKREKIVDILMWIPVINLFVGIYEITRMIKGGTWFERVGILVSTLNGMYVGLGLGVLLFFFMW